MVAGKKTTINTTISITPPSTLPAMPYIVNPSNNDQLPKKLCKTYTSNKHIHYDEIEYPINKRCPNGRRRNKKTKKCKLLINNLSTK